MDYRGKKIYCIGDNDYLYYDSNDKRVFNNNRSLIRFGDLKPNTINTTQRNLELSSSNLDKFLLGKNKVFIHNFLDASIVIEKIISYYGDGKVPDYWRQIDNMPYSMLESLKMRVTGKRSLDILLFKKVMMWCFWIDSSIPKIQVK